MDIFVNLTTNNQSFGERKSSFMKALGMHRAFIHVAKVLEVCETSFKRLWKGDWVEIDRFAIDLPYDIASNLLFGEAIGDKVEKISYKDPVSFEES